MKIVDENYSYNELDGFEPVDLASKKQMKGTYMLTFKNRLLFFNTDFRNVLFGGKYLHVYLNTERKQLLVCAANEFTANSLRVPKNNKKGYTGIGCVSLAKTMESICKYDSSIVSVKFIGIPAKTKRNALIFDLTHFVTFKIEHAK